LRNHRAMDTEELETILRADPYVAPSFQGVHPSDRLPRKIRFPCSVVANTDPHDAPGQHWIAMHYDARGNGTYFDSYGTAPFGALERFFKKHGRTHTFSNVALQGPSRACGFYCVAFLARRCRGETARKIVASYSGRIGEFDTVVRKDVRFFYSGLPMVSVKCRQTCCIK
jgi:hypothetical protein